MAGAYRKAASEVWGYEPPPKGARCIFLPTAILGGLGSVGFGIRLQQALVDEGELSLTAVAGFGFSLLMLMAGIGAIAYRTKVEIDRSQGVITSHRRTLWIRRRRHYPLDDFDRIELTLVRSRQAASVSYSMVCLKGPGHQANLFIVS